LKLKYLKFYIKYYDFVDLDVAQKLFSHKKKQFETFEP